MSFEYPEHPNTGREDPFHDEEGQNLFADDEPEAEISDDPYAVVSSDPGPSFQAGEFETIFRHRGGRVFVLGLIGASLSAFGAAGTIACFFSPSGAAMLLPLALGLLLVGLPSAWAAWMMGRNDLRAIRAGAMESDGDVRTRRGYILGLCGTLIAISPIVAAVLMFLKMLGEQL